MKISTEIQSIANLIGEEKAVEYVAKAGFDAWDFSMFSMVNYDWGTSTFSESEHPLGGSNYLQFARKLRKIGEDNGIHCNQSHAPFPSNTTWLYPYLKRSIECTAEAGGKICIIHPDNNKSAEENAEMYFELLPFAKECGVKIATENMYNWDVKNGHSLFAACATPKSFLEHLEAIDDDYFVGCLDVGHAEMKGSDTTAVEMIKALGNKLQALHLSDNNKLNDSHQIPFSMDLDFGEIVKALKEIDYKGYFTLEAGNYLGDCARENVFEEVKKLAEAAKRLADMFEKI